MEGEPDAVVLLARFSQLLQPDRLTLRCVSFLNEDTRVRVLLLLSSVFLHFYPFSGFSFELQPDLVHLELYALHLFRAGNVGERKDFAERPQVVLRRCRLPRQELRRSCLVKRAHVLTCRWLSLAVLQTGVLWR